MKTLSELLDQPIAKRYFDCYDFSSTTSGNKELITTKMRFPVHHFLIFTGPRGVGKLSSAKIFIKHFFCAQGNGNDHCSACIRIDNGSHPDCIMFPEQTIFIGEEKNPNPFTIRWLKKNHLRYHRHGGDLRIVFFPDGSLLQNEAETALLKILEEPPPYTYFVMIVHEKQKIRETLLSRSFQIPFVALSDHSIKKITNIENHSIMQLLGGSLYFFPLTQTDFYRECNKKIQSSVNHLQDLLELESWFNKNLQAIPKQLPQYDAREVFDFFMLVLLQFFRRQAEDHGQFSNIKAINVIDAIFLCREKLISNQSGNEGLLPIVISYLFAQLRTVLF